jgi:hypothetical protein
MQSKKRRKKASQLRKLSIGQDFFTGSQISIEELAEKIAYYARKSTCNLCIGSYHPNCNADDLVKEYNKLCKLGY